jgi:hypothetical protein
MDNQKKDEVWYILDDFEITDEYFCQFRVIHGISDDIPTTDLYFNIANDLLSYLRDIKDSMRNIFVPSLNSWVHASNQYVILSPKQFKKFSLNIANLYLRASVAKDYDGVMFQEEFTTEIAAYYLNTISDILPLVPLYDVDMSSDSKALLNVLNANNHFVLSNRDLLAKIDGGRQNPLLLSHQHDIMYLTAKIVSHTPIQTKFIIPAPDIARLQPIFNNFLWEEDNDFSDFLQYWRLGKKVAYLPIKARMTSAFIFLLKECFDVSQYTDAIIEETFNLKAIKSKRAKFKVNTESARRVKELMRKFKNT